MSGAPGLIVRCDTPAATRAVGCCLGGALQPGDVIALQGELGAGKTVFVQGLSEGLDAVGRVTSPTFVIMRCHPRRAGAAPMLYHVDAYRLGGGPELLDMGLDDWLAEGAVAVEWADNVADALPDDHLEIRFRADGDRRVLTIAAHGPRARVLLEHLHRCGY